MESQTNLIKAILLSVILAGIAGCKSAYREVKIEEGESETPVYFESSIFSQKELTILPSPQGEKFITLKHSEKFSDFDISPDGKMVAYLIEHDKQSLIRFWETNSTLNPEEHALPEDFDAREIVWHPLASSLFIAGSMDHNFLIFRLTKDGSQLTMKKIFSSSQEILRLMVCPRPFLTGWDNEQKKQTLNYRLFFGLENGNGSYRIVSITDQGHKLYQVVGPKETLTLAQDDVPPSTMVSDWALPVAFHPAGHQLIWQDKKANYYVSQYSRWWDNAAKVISLIKPGGELACTPNGLGVVQWVENKPGIQLYLSGSQKANEQLLQVQFDKLPKIMPDGKGVIGITTEGKIQSLNFLPIDIPLPDVINAWMFTDTKEETDLFEKHFGLFRPNQVDQLYQLYESESYYCDGYDMNSPARPYLVTTDIFWELFGAAYQGVFVVNERTNAIPNFWTFIEKSKDFYATTEPKSAWYPVFAALIDLKDGNKTNTEVAKILALESAYSDILGDEFPYNELKPRGHYNSSEEMKTYFMAFKYLTTIYEKNNAKVSQLRSLPSEIQKLAENWIQGYQGFIAPSRSPLLWSNIKQNIPSYCNHPKDSLTLFPLSWGFDNEILYSTIYHGYLPSDQQIKGENGPRLLPSGLDIAMVFENSLAEKLLEADLKEYPPLIKVIDNLRSNFRENASSDDVESNLYNQWINTAGIQWADTVNSTNRGTDDSIWRAKRLQTGLATWATLRHAAVLVNERAFAECGEGGFEEIVMRSPRGYVEPDPFTLEAIATLFEKLHGIVKQMDANSKDEKLQSLFKGIKTRLQEAIEEVNQFKIMAEKERRHEELTNDEYEKILGVARTAEHHFLIFNSLANEEGAISSPDPMPKVVDVAGDGVISPYLMSGVGKGMEWDHIVPFYGRRQIVKGSVYSYYEFSSNKLMNDQEWREIVTSQELLPWIQPFVTNQEAVGVPETWFSSY